MPNARLSDEAGDVVERVKGLSDGDKQAVVAAIQTANPELFPSSDGARAALWLTLLIGLFLLAGGLIAIIGPIVGDGKDAAPLIIVLTTIVAGVIGLFAKPPTSS